MNPELITRLVKLIEKTGDRVILPDPTSGKAVVVLDLDAYERLCTAPAVAEPATATDAAAPPVDPSPSAPSSREVETGVPAFAPRMRVETAVPEPPQRPAVEKKEVDPPNIPENKAKTKGLEDLTQEELLDKINRDIDAWKTAQDTKRAEELRSAAQDLGPFAATSQLEEEERFFLEPIE